jgi:hypothetical protein
MPKFNTILLSPASNTNIMVESFLSSCIVKYISSLVALKLISYSDLARYRPSMINLIHYLLLTCHYSKLSNSIGLMILYGIALPVLFAVLTFYFIWATDTIVMSKSSIRGTTLVCYVILVNPSICGSWISTIAPIVLLLTRQ